MCTFALMSCKNLSLFKIGGVPYCLFWKALWIKWPPLVLSLSQYLALLRYHVYKGGVEPQYWSGFREISRGGECPQQESCSCDLHQRIISNPNVRWHLRCNYHCEVLFHKVYYTPLITVAEIILDAQEFKIFERFKAIEFAEVCEIRFSKF